MWSIWCHQVFSKDDPKEIIYSHDHTNTIDNICRKLQIITKIQFAVILNFKFLNKHNVLILYQHRVLARMRCFKFVSNFLKFVGLVWFSVVDNFWVEKYTIKSCLEISRAYISCLSNLDFISQNHRAWLSHRQVFLYNFTIYFDVEYGIFQIWWCDAAQALFTPSVVNWVSTYHKMNFWVLKTCWCINNYWIGIRFT